MPSSLLLVNLGEIFFPKAGIFSGCPNKDIGLITGEVSQQFLVRILRIAKIK
jgi:hypothetical protein